MLALKLCDQPPPAGGGGRAAYIDTEGTFRPERVRQIAARFQLDADAVCENVRAPAAGPIPSSSSVRSVASIIFRRKTLRCTLMMMMPDNIISSHRRASSHRRP